MRYKKMRIKLKEAPSERKVIAFCKYFIFHIEITLTCDKSLRFIAKINWSPQIQIS